MKKFSCMLSLLLALILSATVNAQTLQEAYDDAVAAQADAEAAYDEATYWRDEVLALVAELNALLEDVEYEWLPSELWDTLDAAWIAVEDSHSPYNEGNHHVIMAEAEWDAYYEAESDELKIFILIGIKAYYLDAADCFDEAADAYFALEGELDDLCEEVDDGLVTAMNNWINMMNAAKAAMETQKTNATTAATQKDTALAQANASKANALAHMPTNQAAYDTLMTAGDDKLASGAVASGLGDNGVAAAEHIANGSATEVGANALFAIATNETYSVRQRLFAAASARDKFNDMKNEYADAVGDYNTAKTDFEQAKSSFDSAQMQ